VRERGEKREIDRLEHTHREIEREGENARYRDKMYKRDRQRRT
jgi:hypothetical protein